MIRFRDETSVLYHVTFDDYAMVCGGRQAAPPRPDVDAIATALASLERLLALLHGAPRDRGDLAHLPNRASRLIVLALARRRRPLQPISAR